MADPDEKDEIDNVKTPGDGLGHPGDPKAIVDLSDIDIPGVQDDDQQDGHDVVEAFPRVFNGAKQVVIRMGRSGSFFHQSTSFR
jgi:hypothetical protein